MSYLQRLETIARRIDMLDGKQDHKWMGKELRHQHGAVASCRSAFELIEAMPRSERLHVESSATNPDGKRQQVNCRALVERLEHLVGGYEKTVGATFFKNMLLKKKATALSTPQDLFTAIQLGNLMMGTLNRSWTTSPASGAQFYETLTISDVATVHALGEYAGYKSFQSFALASVGEAFAVIAAEMQKHGIDMSAYKPGTELAKQALPQPTH